METLLFAGGGISTRQANIIAFLARDWKAKIAKIKDDRFSTCPNSRHVKDGLKTRHPFLLKSY